VLQFGTVTATAVVAVLSHLCHQVTPAATSLLSLLSKFHRFCGLVVRVPGYRSRGPGFDSRRYQIFIEVVGLERGPLSLECTIEELLGRKNIVSGAENREYGRRDPSRIPHDILYLQTLALTLPTSAGCSVGTIRSQTQATEFTFFSF
jgi:hypothetical protein